MVLLRAVQGSPTLDLFHCFQNDLLSFVFLRVSRMASATVTHFSFVLQTAAVSDVADTFIHSSPLCRSVFGSEAEHHFVRLSSAGDRPTTKNDRATPTPSVGGGRNFTLGTSASWPVPVV